MGRTKRELLESMDSDELTSWLVYYRVQPFGEARQDFRMGQICATTAGPHVKKGHSVAPIDFIPERQKDRDNANIVTMLKAWAAVHNDRKKK